jgi:hypothetical protein
MALSRDELLRSDSGAGISVLGESVRIDKNGPGALAFISLRARKRQFVNELPKISY